jgi:hypothetical protein
MKTKLIILLIGIASVGCDSQEQKEIESTMPPFESELDNIISENEDNCKAHLYSCLKFALGSNIEKSRSELALFEDCMGDIELQGSYPECAKQIRLIIKEENSEYLKATVEVLIPYLDSLQYDSLSLFQPSEPYTVTVSD